MSPKTIATFILLALNSAFTFQARSDEIADFYKGRSITVLIGGSAGASYDTQGRLIARYMQKYIPASPNFIVQNMTGAGGLKMMNYLSGQAARDGTVLAMVPNTMPAMQAIGAQGVGFDLGKVNWIGTISPVTVTMSALKESGIRSIEDVRKKEYVVAASARGAITYTIPAMMNALLGTKFKIVTGYEGLQDISLALERGEADVVESSVTNWKIMKPDWLRAGRIIMFVQTEPRSSELPGVPTAEELTATPADRKVIDIIVAGSKLGFPMAAAPGVPPERIEALRRAFMAAMMDDGFVKEATAMNLDINPVGGEALAKTVAEVLGASPDIIERARPIISP
jgi:tripartite-type tricarboxylate transporter receptor subunit TctC